jgi:circadian clock protein KaiC
MAKSKTDAKNRRPFSKCPTGIQGLDEITGGGVPRGRPTLVCGGPGCGKSLLGMQFLIQGATRFDEPGVLITFEETAKDVSANFSSLGFDVDQLVAQNKLSVDYVRVERSEIEETGEYDLDGLFVRIAHAVDSIGAKRIVLDTIESLFSGLTNTAILRAELRRLFRWLKDRGLTAIVTGERGDATLTRQGLEEYVSDCVIFLDHRVTDQISTRRIRVVKYRGSIHGTNEYPFLIDEKGMSVLPVTSLGLDHAISTERISTGVPRLDAMLGGKGLYRGASVLISGTAGTGKSTLAAHFAAATCRAGERCLYFAFEESQAQIIRNMRSVGLDLEPFVRKGLLRFFAVRPSTFGLETHLATMHKLIEEYEPAGIVVDPVTSLMNTGLNEDVRAMLTRLVDFLKQKQITSVFTTLTHPGGGLEATQVAVSSIMDTWLLVRDIEIGGERNRGLYVLKSRGMAHSNQIREFVLTSHGVELLDAYLGPEGVLTGSARLSQEAREEAERIARQEDIARKERELEGERDALETQIAALRKQFELREEELRKAIGEDEQRERSIQADRLAMASSRKAESAGNNNQKTRRGGRK